MPANDRRTTWTGHRLQLAYSYTQQTMQIRLFLFDTSLTSLCIYVAHILWSCAVCKLRCAIWLGLGLGLGSRLGQELGNCTIRNCAVGSTPARVLLAQQPYASYSHPCDSVTKQYTLVLV